jgi:UDP-N-acetylmuramoylalanine--D-glutamate ligase
MIYLYGLGISNIACANYLERKKIPFKVWDDNLENQQKIQQEHPTWAFVDLNQISFCSADRIIIAPGISPSSHGDSLSQRAQQMGAHYGCDVDFFLEEKSFKNLIGVTGTNGKSTVTSLIGHILSELGYSVQIGGNIGIPVFDMPEAEVYVLELSSFQLPLIQQKKFDAGILLNIAPDHLDYHGSMDAYVNAKKHLFELVKKGGLQLLSEPSEYTGRMTQSSLAVTILDQQAQKMFDPSDLPEIFQRAPHRLNFCTAWVTVQKMFNISWRSFVKAAATYQGLPHRQQIVGQMGLLTFVNDSKATNVAATLKALENFDSIYWFVGGIFKEKDLPFEMLFPHHERIKNIYCFGRDQEVFYRYACQYGLGVKRFETLQEAFHTALAEAQASGAKATLLLAPCCTSLDQFQNYQERGLLFINLVQETIGSLT